MRMGQVRSETADRAAALLGRLGSPVVGMPERRDRLIGSLATASSSRQVEQVVDRPLIVRVLAVMRRLNRPIGKYQEVRWKTSYATIGHSPKLRLISLEITLNGGWANPRIGDGSYVTLGPTPA